MYYNIIRNQRTYFLGKTRCLLAVVGCIAPPPTDQQTDRMIEVTLPWSRWRIATITGIWSRTLVMSS